MAFLDVRQLRGSSRFGLAIEYQADFFDMLETRLIIPLLPEPDAESLDFINPIVVVEEAEYSARVELIATVPTNALGDTLGTAGSHQNELSRALDRLISGY